MTAPLRSFVFASLLTVVGLVPVFAQNETATVSGRVTDVTGAIVRGAEVHLLSVERGVSREAKTNDAGIYTFPGCQPGQYHMTVRKEGFRQIEFVGLILNVQDHIESNFRLQVGSVSESVTVSGGAPLVNTEDATVSTVVDRNLAENLPLNGRSFQSLIELTPGVVLTPATVIDGGQFSVNGQRGISNYWMVDGVSANFGANASAYLPGSSSAGTSAAFGGALGGTNSLVSVDALQEFRIQTSTYAPEYGRTPGGQVSIVTRSGSSQFHGTAFDYLRNDLFDANDWFNGYINNPPLPKAKERQNDFGGTFSGPIMKEKTFFFFSYEGLRLRLPQTVLSTVPDLAARQNAVPAVQPFLNAFPLPSGPDDVANGTAQFNASVSNPASLDAYSIRLDQRLGGKLTIFGRYNYSPSDFRERGGLGSPLNDVFTSKSTTQTATIGLTWSPSPLVSNDARFNYSRSNGRSNFFLDGFHGAVPVTSLPFPSPFTSRTALFALVIDPLIGSQMQIGQNSHLLQRQINITDSLSIQHGLHSIKIGGDFRQLAPFRNPNQYLQEADFSTVAAAESGDLSFVFTTSTLPSSLSFHNLGAFVQDNWRVVPRLTVTYGLRWDVDFAPSSSSGPPLPAVMGLDFGNLSKLALAPVGTPVFRTTYGNVAPRIGVAYVLSDIPDKQTVLRGGFGLFYDLASSQAGNAYGFGGMYPYGAANFFFPGGKFPASGAVAAPPVVSPQSFVTDGIFAYDPKTKLPYVLEWSMAAEQALGRDQSLSVSYIGSAGERLLQTAVFIKPNATFNRANLVTNTGVSNYNALQIQFKRRVTKGLQALASYSWAHSIDTGSTGSFDNTSNTLVAGNENQNRGPSDFDIRNSFSGAFTYEIPFPKANPFIGSILRHWSLQSTVQLHSAPPEDIFYESSFSQRIIKGSVINIRPDLVPNRPLYLHGRQFPGGKAFNPVAFMTPPADANGNPLRQGNLGRNALRAFGATQWDFAVHRDFPLRESLKLQFRAEMFNVLNHPNFGPLSQSIDGGGFGLAMQMLNRSLADIAGSGLSPLYQVGGPRSMQFALKLVF